MPPVTGACRRSCPPPRSCIKTVGRHNGAVKTRLALVLPCLVACAAGVLSCSDQSDNPLNSGVDAATEAGADSAALGGSDVAALKLDAEGGDAPGLEAVLPVDAQVDRSAIGQDVGASDAAVVSDVAIVYDDAPQTMPDGGVALGGDAGLDGAAKDAAATETRAPDATQLDAGTSDAKVDGAAPDVTAKDASEDGPTSGPDAGLDVGLVANCGRIKCDCTYSGIKLWGNVQYVTMFADFKVKRSYFPDLNVAETTFPSKCGQWHTVTMFPDFTVQIVDIAEDFSISNSDSFFPGIPGQ